ncbi:hypothetical protein [Plantibacter sp. RU18]|uniref:hypothetical protein n=1 Tax=Plantibacter sp. RU18 TaxID=3158143 RepID=UPI003D36F181
MVDLAVDGSIATGKLRDRLKDVQIRKNRIRDQLGSTDEELRTRTDTVLAYLDVLERPEALYVGALDSIKRQLLTAFFRRIWVDDDDHQAGVAVELQPLLAVVRDSAIATAQQKSTGEISGAHSVEQLNRYLQVICSSNANLVDPTGSHSKQFVHPGTKAGSPAVPAETANFEPLSAWSRRAAYAFESPSLPRACD